MTVIVLISVTGHVAIARMYNYLLELPAPYFLCLLQAPELVLVLYLVG